jgi:NlpC/P60 family putative phage cell wall peptidase
MVGTSLTMTAERLEDPEPAGPMSDARFDIVSIARTWLGTPYHYQASLRGVGTDCIGLVRGIYRELHGREPEAVPPYTRDWAEATGEETLISAARRHLIEIGPNAVAPGDVLVFRYRSRAVAKHAAILTTPATMIHAIEGAPVSEVAYSPWWRRHLAAAFRFPPPTAPSPRTSRGEGRGEGRPASTGGWGGGCGAATSSDGTWGRPSP